MFLVITDIADIRSQLKAHRHNGVGGSAWMVSTHTFQFSEEPVFMQHGDSDMIRPCSAIFT